MIGTGGARVAVGDGSTGIGWEGSPGLFDGPGDATGLAADMENCREKEACGSLATVGVATGAAGIPDGFHGPGCAGSSVL